MRRRIIPLTAILTATLALTSCASNTDEQAVRDVVQQKMDQQVATAKANGYAATEKIGTIEPWRDGYSVLVREQTSKRTTWYAYGVLKENGDWVIDDWNTVPGAYVGKKHAGCYALVGDDSREFEACNDLD